MSIIKKDPYWRRSRLMMISITVMLLIVLISGSAFAIGGANKETGEVIWRHSEYMWNYYDSITGDNDGVGESSDMVAGLPRYEPRIEINGSLLYYYYTDQAAGTGVLQPFIRFQNQGEERGVSASLVPKAGSGIYPDNDATKYVFDEDASWTKAVKLSDLPIVEIGGVLYYEFYCDINQTANNPYISWEVQQIWQSRSPYLVGWYTGTILPGEPGYVSPADAGYKDGAHHTLYIDMNGNNRFDPAIDEVQRLIWDLDGGFGSYPVSNKTVVIDYEGNSGSGRPDLKHYVRADLFDPAIEWVILAVDHGYSGIIGDGTLMSEFGPFKVGANDGFDEWGYFVYPKATKSGMKFHDLDADGIKDAGEPGLSGWTIFVDYDNDGVLDAGEPSAVTGADGTYTITDIVAGTWRVKEVLQAGWIQSFPALGYHEETFVGGMNYPNNDFGNYRTASKSGVKFEDMDADGLDREAGEPGLAGWTIYVDYDDDGVLDAGEPSATTGADGSYSITGITPGTWKVKEVAQSGWTQSFPGSGFHQETFTSGASLTENNFGNWRPASKSGVKFEDMDADGLDREAGEPGLSGWTIFVDYDNDGVLDAGEPSAVTAADGSYTINGINLGTWKVREVAQSGWTQSFPGSGFHQETFTSGASLTENNFGNWRPASKSGMKFEDMDADGIKDAEDLGLSGWTIFVDYDDDGVLDTGEPSAVTAADGSYTINGINLGTWKVREVAQDGWTQSFPGAPGYHEETFTSRAALTGNDFGNWRFSSKSGMKFRDDNQNGMKDPGELGISGWTIVLYKGEPGDLELVASTTTDADGLYSFSNMIKPGVDYFVAESDIPLGWIQTYPNASTPGAMFIEGLGYVWAINLESGENDTCNDFGNIYYHNETAWGFYGPIVHPANALNNDFLSFLKTNNWGWSIGPLTAGNYDLTLLAACGSTKVSNKTFRSYQENGTNVGSVSISYNGSSATITYTATAPHMLEEVHLWVGSTKLPIIKKDMTNAPGLFPYAPTKDNPISSDGRTWTITVNNLTSPIYVAAHAVVTMYEIMD